MELEDSPFLLQFCTLSQGNHLCFHSSQFFNEDGSLKEVHKINEMYAAIQEELKVTISGPLQNSFSSVDCMNCFLEKLTFFEYMLCSFDFHNRDSGDGMQA